MMLYHLPTMHLEVRHIRMIWDKSPWQITVLMASCIGNCSMNMNTEMGTFLKETANFPHRKASCSHMIFFSHCSIEVRSSRGKMHWGYFFFPWNLRSITWFMRRSLNVVWFMFYSSTLVFVIILYWRLSFCSSSLEQTHCCREKQTLEKVVCVLWFCCKTKQKYMVIRLYK